MKNSSTWFVIAAAAALMAAAYGCSLAQAQTPPDDDELRRSITVSGTGSVRVKPDLATATVGVSKTSPKLSEAKSAADAAIAKVRTALRNAGVAAEDIQTVQYQIYRVQANPQAGVREPYWKVVHMLLARTKKPDTIASIVDAAVGAGATDVQNVAFSVDELAPHRTKSRELAIRAAREKAQHLASLLGIGVGEVVSVMEVGESYPVQMAANVRFDMAGEGFGGGSGISGGQVEVNTTVQVVFGIR
jgi:uncharacterized protein YggE